MIGPTENGEAPEIQLGGVLRGFPDANVHHSRMCRTTTYPLLFVNPVSPGYCRFFFESGRFARKHHDSFFGSGRFRSSCRALTFLRKAEKLAARSVSGNRGGVSRRSLSYWRFPRGEKPPGRCRQRNRKPPKGGCGNRGETARALLKTASDYLAVSRVGVKNRARRQRRNRPMRGAFL